MNSAARLSSRSSVKTGRKGPSLKEWISWSILLLAPGLAQADLTVYQPTAVAANGQSILVATPVCSPGNLVSPTTNLPRQILSFPATGATASGTLFADLTNLPGANVACTSTGTAGVETDIAVSPGKGGFSSGEVYASLGTSIYQIPPGGGTPTLFVTLPQPIQGLIFDTGGNFGFNLLASTTSGSGKNASGNIYTVTSAGTVSGALVTIKDLLDKPSIAPVAFGTIKAGDLVLTGQNTGSILDVSPTFKVTTFATGFVQPVGIDFIPMKICAYYGAILGPSSSKLLSNELNPNPSIVKIYPSSFFNGHNGQMLIRDEYGTGSAVIYAVDSSGTKTQLGTAPGQEEGGAFVNVCAVQLACPANSGQVSVPYSSSLTATGGTPPYTFSIASGTLPGGLSLNTSTGAITGTPTTAGTFTFTASVVDSTGGKSSISCTIIIAPPPLTLTCPNASGQVGVAYNSALSAGGGVPPYAFSIISGTLPPGLQLIGNKIKGNPTTAGTFSFKAEVVDSTGAKAIASCSIVIAAPYLSLACPSASAQVGVAYSSAYVATGGVPPYKFSTTVLPPGLTLNSQTGAITGTPLRYGTYQVKGTVFDSSGTAKGTATASCTINVVPVTLTLLCASSSAQVNVPYSSALVAAGGVPPYTYSISSGMLPTGLTLNPSTGAITGTPAAGTGGQFYSFTAQVVDARKNSAGTVTVNCVITVSQPPPLTLACPASSAQVGVLYSSSLSSTGGVPPYTFSISTGQLPPGLGLNTFTGAITGVPKNYGTFNFTAQVTDSNIPNAVTTSNCSITVAPPPVTVSCASGSGQVGVAYSSALSAAGGISPYTFSIIAGSLPGGLTLNPSTGAITGTPSAYGTFSYTAQAVDSTGTAAGTGTVNCKIAITPPVLTLSGPSVTTIQINTPYNSSLVASGGAPPYTYSITAGSLPPGLSLNASTGVITGTPNSVGIFSFTAQVADSESTAMTATINSSITITPPPLTLACPSLTTSVINVPYSSALAAGGGVAPYTFSITSGSLPPGITLNPSTGAISGTPNTLGTFSFTAQVTDSSPLAKTHRPKGYAGTTSVNCSITIIAPTLTLACPAVTAAQVSTPFNSSLVGSGGIPPYTFSITAGSLPPGLTLNTSTGAITGTPNTLGTFSFTASVADSQSTPATAAVSCSITINGPGLSLGCPSITTSQINVPYSSAVVASGGVGPYTFSLASGALPPGLTLNTSSGAITGTPNTLGTFSFTAKVVDSEGTPVSATANCSITIAPPPLTLSPPSLTTSQINTPYSSSLVAAGGVSPYTYSISTGSLPPGLTLNTSTGAITGTPNTLGTFSFTAKVTDSQATPATATTNVSITITPPPLTLACPSAKSSQINTPYSSSLVGSGGVPPYTFSITGGSLPPGLNLNTSTGAITGTPTTLGAFSFTAKVTDSQGTPATATVSCTITITPPPLTLTCPNGSGTQNTQYNSGLTAAGGVPPYSFSIASGALPPGLTLNATTGAITGTPTTLGTFNFTAQVTDSFTPTPATTTTNCSIIISPQPLTLACPNVGQQNSPYTSGLVAMGGIPPYTFSILAGTLPPGLTLNTSTGAISGTPTGQGTTPFTAQVMDSSNTPQGTVTNSCSLIIIASPLNNCLTTSATSVLVNGPNATAYIPNGSWTETGTGINVVPLEGTGTRALIPTPNPVNSCSSNWVTGQTVCSGNSNDIYLITGSTLNSTLTSGATGTETFSGGSCQTCGVIIDATTNRAAIEVGLKGGSCNSGGIQFLDLAGNSFETPICLNATTSPGIFIDPVFHYVLSPNEQSDYQIVQLKPSIGVFNNTALGGASYESAGEDCSTGIAVGTDQSTGSLFLADLTQATFTGSTWTAPSQLESFPEFQSLVGGTNAIAVAPTTHYAVVAGQTGGNLIGVVQLPANSGTGTPVATDWVAANLPNDPDGQPFSLGLTPHTVTAYVSPNTNKALAVLTEDSRNFLATVDMAGLLAATRQPGTHFVAPGVDLLGSGIVSYVSIKAALQCPTTSNWDAQVPYSSFLTDQHGTAPYTFSITSGALPTGLSLNASTGAITGTPTLAGMYNFTAKVTDAGGNNLSSSCGINIGPAFSITGPTIAGKVGVPYSDTLTAAGGQPPYSYSTGPGTFLPPGLSINSSTGAITGTPTAPGNFPFTGQATDSAGVPVTVATSIFVSSNSPSPLTSACPLNSASQGIAYFSALASDGVPPYSISVTSGSLPPGLTFNTSTGALTGLPTTNGAFTFSTKVNDSTSATATASGCSITVAAASPAILSSCQTANALSIMAQGKSVAAYVPNGGWAEFNTGIQYVPLEGTPGALTAITVPDFNPIVSCSSNWVTGQTVCVDNVNSVFLLNGSTVSGSALTDSASGFQFYNTGLCTTCSVGMDATTNRAVLSIANGFSTGALQYLDLATNTFETPISVPGETATEISVDPIHQLVLSPASGFVNAAAYQILQAQPTPTLFTYINGANDFGSSFLSAAAEDCTTGIALGTQWYNGGFFIADLTQATFDPATQLWNAPNQVQTLPEFNSSFVENGAISLAIAPGSHLGIVTGEYCCSPGFGVIQLPSTSGSGIPAIQDWAEANLPPDPGGNSWQQGEDPHLITAYVSPNSGKAIGVLANDARNYLALVDMQALLNAPRQLGTHFVSNSVNLVTSKILAWVPAANPAVGCPSQVLWDAGVSYLSPFTVSGGIPPYTFSINSGSLPAGLFLNSSTGEVSGTPMTAGTYTFTGQVNDSTGRPAGIGVSPSCSIQVYPTLSMSCPTTVGIAGMPYSDSLSPTGGSGFYSIFITLGSLPPGVSVNNGTGALTGTPGAPGTYSFTATVNDVQTGAIATISCKIVVNPAPLSMACPSSNAQVGMAYFPGLTPYGGIGPYNFSITSGSLPTGLSLNTTTGAITGTPGTSGSYTFTAQVTDSLSELASTGSCSINVAAVSPAVLASCQPSNAISVMVQGTTATAYVPSGSWSENATGFNYVTLEGSGAPLHIATATTLNSCASNWVTGETVCSDNNAVVYPITGSSVGTALTGSAFGELYYPGGPCVTCGIALDAGTNTAVIPSAFGFYGFNAGFEFLNLGGGTFGNSLLLANNEGPSEATAVDPVRHLVLSPNENYCCGQPDYSIVITQTAPSLYTWAGPALPANLSSAAEDCTTGIALAGQQFSGDIFIADLSQAIFNPIAGNWSAPSQVQNLPEFANLVDGTSGIAIAPGSHLGLVTGEFCCGNGFGAILLPATSGSGTPSIQDWVEASIPNDPSGAAWQNGQDPHMLTAYVSPNTGKALGVIGNDARTYLAIIDLQALLNAPRTPGTHTVSSSVDLIGSGILTWVLQ